MPFKFRSAPTQDPDGSIPDVILSLDSVWFGLVAGDSLLVTSRTAVRVEIFARFHF
jgi:hypothetical protein